MEEIKVNDYVRERGEILKIEIFEKLPEYNYESVLVKFKEYAGSNVFTIKEIEKWKHSENIIDLIEVGDYVNGMYVSATYLEGERHYIKLNGLEGTRVYDENIKNVVTHEQFNSIKYEVE